MQIDSGIVGVVITVLITLLSLSFWVGTLSQRVKQNRENIEKAEREQQLIINQLRTEFASYQKDNKSDHKDMGTKLDQIIRNGHK